MTENFNFDVLLAEAEARLDQEAVPEHLGTEITLAEGEHWTGTYRGGDIDDGFDPPRAVVLLTELDGELRFLRVPDDARAGDREGRDGCR